MTLIPIALAVLFLAGFPLRYFALIMLAGVLALPVGYAQTGGGGGTTTGGTTGGATTGATTGDTTSGATTSGATTSGNTTAARNRVVAGQIVLSSQIAICLVLLMAAGLLLRTLRNYASQKLGIDAAIWTPAASEIGPSGLCGAIAA